TRHFIAALVFLAALSGAAFAEEAAKAPAYRDIHAIFARHCLACHDAKEAEGELVLENFQTLMKGGENGPVLVPGKSAESVLLQKEENKKSPLRPPPKKGDKLREREIAVIRAWIDAGAAGPKEGEVLAPLVQAELPKIQPRPAPPRSIYSLAYAS